MTKKYNSVICNELIGNTYLSCILMLFSIVLYIFFLSQFPIEKVFIAIMYVLKAKNQMFLKTQF